MPPLRPNGIRLEYRLEEPVTLVGSVPYRHIERWDVSAVVDDPDAADNGRDIGYAKVIVVNLEAGVTLSDLTDAATGEWTEVAGPRDALADAAARATSPEDPEPDETSLLVLDRVWIEPDARGCGLGPIVASCAILRLGRGCRLAACYPAPFETSQVGEDRDRSIAALGRVWAKVGFTPWNDGVWMLDLHTTDARDALERLLTPTRTESP